MTANAAGHRRSATTRGLTLGQQLNAQNVPGRPPPAVGTASYQQVRGLNEPTGMHARQHIAAAGFALDSSAMTGIPVPRSEGLKAQPFDPQARFATSRILVVDGVVLVGPKSRSACCGVIEPVRVDRCAPCAEIVMTACVDLLGVTT
jgi:hypothetical protein